MDTEPRPLRFVVFGESIVSDWNNAAATTTRAVLRALVAAGHDVMFLEERGNRPTVELLRARGAAGLSAFAVRHPTFGYRTYEIPRGSERLVWPGREIATADAVIVQDTAPDEVIETVAALGTTRLVRLLQVTRDAVPSDAKRFDHLLVPIDGPVASSDGAMPFGPAVDGTTPLSEVGTMGVAVVAYDDTDTAARVATALVEDGPTLVAPGDVATDGFRYVPEVELGSVLRAASVAVVVARGGGRLAAARFLLPLSFGCEAIAVASDGMPAVPANSGVVRVEADDVASVARAMGRETGAMGRASVPTRFTGTDHAVRLVGVVKAILRERRGTG